MYSEKNYKLYLLTCGDDANDYLTRYDLMISQNVSRYESWKKFSQLFYLSFLHLKNVPVTIIEDNFFSIFVKKERINYFIIKKTWKNLKPMIIIRLCI